MSVQSWGSLTVFRRRGSWRAVQRGTIAGVPLVLLLVILAVLGAVAVVAAGRGDVLGPESPRRGPLAELPLGATPEDVDRLRLSLGWRGYRMDEVDQVLDDLRDELAALQGTLRDRDARVAELEAGRTDGLTAGSSDGPGTDRSPRQSTLPKEG